MELLFLAEPQSPIDGQHAGFLPLSSTPSYSMAHASPVCSPPIAFFSAAIAFLQELIVTAPRRGVRLRGREFDRGEVLPSLLATPGGHVMQGFESIQRRLAQGEARKDVARL